MGMGEPEFFGALVHIGDEAALRACDALGEHDRRIVARLDGEAADQVLDADLAFDVEEHRGRMAVPAAGAPRVLGNVIGIIEVQAPGVKLVEHRLGGHQLRHLRRLHRLVGVLLVEHRAAFVILDEGERGVGRRRLRKGRRGAAENRGYRHNLKA